MRRIILLLAVVVVSFISSFTLVDAAINNNEWGNQENVPLNIVYFGQSNAIGEGLVGGNHAQEFLEARNIASEEALVDSQNVDAVILDEVGASRVNRRWIREEYAAGTSIVFLGSAVRQAPEILQNNCISIPRNPNRNNYLIASFSVNGENSAEVTKVRDTFMNSCGEEIAEGITGTVYIRYQTLNDVASTYESFANLLESHLLDKRTNH